MQRAQNGERSAAMHAARLAHENVEPATHRPAGRVVAQPDLLSNAYVGCSGWYYRHWANAFYPAALSSSRWFDHYASQFNTVELNAPFYSWPSLKTVATWKRQAGNRHLIYSIKVNESITHVKRFSRTDTLVKDFGLIAELLGRNFGCFLYQLPPSFHYSPTRLQRIMRQLDPRLRNVVEFRHRSWWNQKVYTAFSDAGTIFCSTSAPNLPDELVKTAGDIYIRFHGTRKWYRHDYSASELAVWSDRAMTSGASRVWAYFNNDRDGHAITNARKFRRQLMPTWA
jgi:uncharacterized protein YecE (DUF72 family)